MIKNKNTKLFVVAITELLILFISMQFMSPLAELIVKPFSASPNADFIYECAILSMFIIPILAVIVLMKITYPQKLQVFTNGGFNKCLKSLITGLLLGLLLNSFLCLGAYLSGSVSLKYQGLNLRLLLIFIPCFIQCVAEEVLLRGYAASYLEDNYRTETVVFVTSVLFVFHHIGNLNAFGFSSMFCLNAFLSGIMLYLLMKISGSIWTCFGFHTAWNFTQEYIFGMPNSGGTSDYVLLKGENAVGNFFTNKVYGNEGTIACAVVLSICIFILLKLYNKKTAYEYDDDITPYA